jgi:signal transduction histidine kinase
MRRPPTRDIWLAACLAVPSEIPVAVAHQEPRPAAALLALCMTVPFAWRRVHVLPVTVAVVASVLAQTVFVDGTQPLVPVCLALAAYNAGHELDARLAWVALAIVIVPLWAGLLVEGSEIGEFVSVAVIFGAAWAFGRGLRDRGSRVSALAAHAEQLERETAEREAAAAAAERERIARELHDIVAHSISVIAVQTQAVRRRLGPGSEREQRDLQDVETTARDAMSEMRRLLGVLRADAGPAALSPQPGLAQLPRLVEQAGIPVTVTTTGDERPLPPGVDLAAFRVIQESLTNVRKHAAGANAAVELRYDDDALAIRIENAGDPVAMNGHRGFGLVGMRERIQLYGGTLSAAPRPGGGFLVEARLPLAGRA